MNLFQKLFDQHKVYVVPGSEFGCKMFGWFRINFAVDSKMLEVGMNRIERALTGSTQATEANHVGVGKDTTMNADMKEDEMMTNTKSNSIPFSTMGRPRIPDFCQKLK